MRSDERSTTQSERDVFAGKSQGDALCHGTKSKKHHGGEGCSPENNRSSLKAKEFPQNSSEAPKENKKIKLEKSGQNLARSFWIGDGVGF